MGYKKKKNFRYRLSKPKGLVLLQEIVKLTKLSPHRVSNPRTPDLPACSIVPQSLSYRVPYLTLVGSRTFTSPQRSDRLWDPPDLLSNGYRAFNFTSYCGCKIRLK
jgi:hypothetical protein